MRMTILGILLAVAGLPLTGCGSEEKAPQVYSTSKTEPSPDASLADQKSANAARRGDAASKGR